MNGLTLEWMGRESGHFWRFLSKLFDTSLVDQFIFDPPFYSCELCANVGGEWTIHIRKKQENMHK